MWPWQSDSIKRALVEAEIEPELPPLLTWHLSLRGTSGPACTWERSHPSRWLKSSKQEDTMGAGEAQVPGQVPLLCFLALTVGHGEWLRETQQECGVWEPGEDRVRQA